MELALLRHKILPLLKKLFKFFLAYKFFRVWFPRKVKSIKDATVLVTGAGGGLGACLCKEFAKRGAARLVLWDLNEEALESVAKELRCSYPALKDVRTQTVNLSEREEIYKAAKTALQDVGGRMDIVINNAGMVSGSKFLDTPDFQHELTFQVNTLAPMFTIKAFLPEMLKNTGGPSPAILNISSMASFMGAPGMVDYCASKSATRGFCDAFAAELKQLGLWSKCKVQCICPSHISTKLFKGFQLAGSISMSPEFVAQQVAVAYECEQELVCLPRHLAPAIPLMALAQALCSYNLPNPQPRTSPLANFDRSQADHAIRKMSSERSLEA